MRRGRWGIAGAVALCGALAVGSIAFGQLSGRFGLDLIARRIPTTLTGEIKLDTPSEFAMLEFGLASRLILNVDLTYTVLNLDGAVNMAGPEHLILKCTSQWEQIGLAPVILDKLSVVPEIWFAVPFEAVVDVNNLPNSVVIPPADPMFVKARLTTAFTIAGFSVNHLIMFEDVNFPNPGSSFEPLYYPEQSQSFSIGSLMRVSWRASIGVSINCQVGISASSSANSVKGHSAPGSVDPGHHFGSLSIGGIRLGDLPLGGFTLYDAQVGFGATVSSDTDLSASVSFSARLFDKASLSTSLTLFPAPHRLGGISLSFSMEPFRFAFALDELDLTSMSASLSTRLNLGGMTGMWATSLTGLERGLTGLSTRLSLTHGIFSASTGVSYAQRGDKFGFASLSTQLSFRLSPGVISVQATFGRYGLTRAAVTVGVTF